MKKKKKLGKGQIVLHAAFILLVLMYVVPFVLTISISFSDETSLIRNGYSLIPHEFSLEAYKMVFRNPGQILQSYKVTILFTVVATALAVLVMGVMAYPLSRPTFRFRGPLSFFVLFTMLFSGGMVPTYLLIVKYLHMDNTIWVYILPGLVSAYNLIIIRTNYRSLPEELIEAAKIDGARELYICFKIVMPLCKPVLASVGFLFFVAKWNDWNTALLYITDPKLYSLQYLLQKILNEAEFLKQLAEAGELMGGEVFPSESYRYAMALVAAGPVLCVFPFFQKYFARGMTLGGVKG
ncbi:MAG TPA: carbohydrate ABC transporter permease [Candidatus Eisenbergiella pullistercoris]|uniref:Carbohydrate ABC transporter permease n=1 Tax=Candidatus Eisenbergiella pullistercoris TaxID=2838555 RepID=A0A9D1YMG4_9FIRM|nr:carbohydrate ABC transporter permease [Candidatus Eisenbergiella pullistercoris]